MAKHRKGNYNRSIRFKLLSKYPNYHDYIAEEWSDDRWEVQYAGVLNADEKATIIENEIVMLPDFCQEDIADNTIVFEKFEDDKVREKRVDFRRKRKGRNERV